jgi:release factor glutamine methyltransferase
MMDTSILSGVASRLTPLSDTPALDASVLIAQIVNKPRTWVMAHPEIVLTHQQKKQLDDSLLRLEAGEPFPYVLGHWEFFGLDLDIAPDVLIPRPETELLVEKALAWLRGSLARRTVADVGTGSGAIALSLAMNMPDVRVLATDLSFQALQVARRNAIKLDVNDRVDLVQCDLLPHPPGPLATGRHFDLICANLPYIPTESLRGLAVFGREPSLALDGGSDGFEVIRRLLEISPQWLAPDGRMLLEIESTRGTQAVSLVYDLLPGATIHLHRDLAGQDRLLEITL